MGRKRISCSFQRMKVDKSFCPHRSAVKKKGGSIPATVKMVQYI